jgi:hypothetical protein
MLKESTKNIKMDVGRGMGTVFFAEKCLQEAVLPRFHGCLGMEKVTFLIGKIA